MGVLCYKWDSRVTIYLYKKGGNLYISNLKSITKIASNVGEFYLDHKKEKVLWTEEREDEDTGIRLVDCYTQEIKNGEKKQIASQAHLTGFTENFSKITDRKSVV